MISGGIAFSPVNGPPGTKRTMKNVAVMITNRTGMVWSRRRTTKRNMVSEDGGQMTEDGQTKPDGKQDRQVNTPRRVRATPLARGDFNWRRRDPLYQEGCPQGGVGRARRSITSSSSRRSS